MKIDRIQGRGFGSNIFVLRNDEVFMLDAGSGMDLEHVKQKLKEFGLSLGDVDVLINTHCHFDHTGGDYSILEIADCELWASEPAAKALREGDEKTILAGMASGDLEPLEVSRILKEGDEIKVNDSTFTVLSTPGHTKGSISLYEPEEKILFSGAAVFRGGIGRMDLPTASRDEMKKTLNRLSKLDVRKLYPGHGPVAEENAQRHIEMAKNFLI